jgi:hypothetical protein
VSPSDKISNSSVYIINNQKIPWSRFLLEKLIVPQLAKKIPTFYGT